MKISDNHPPALYNVGDLVYIKEIYVLDDTTMHVRELDHMMIVKIEDVHERCSEPFGYPYVLKLPEEITEKYNCAKVCYWESDICGRYISDEDLFWQVWGDQ